MGFKVITPPSAVIPIAEVMLHLKDDSADANRQAEVAALLEAARDHAEHYCGRSFGSQTLELALDAFPAGGIELPRGPVTSITSVKYLNSAGAEQTVSATDYTLDDYGLTPWILPAYGLDWPSALDTANAVKVRYVAGAAALPKAVRNALLLFVGHLDQNREAVATGQGGAIEMPLGVKALLDTQKVWAL